MKNKLNLSAKSLKIQEMFNDIAPSYDFLNRLLSLGQDLRWRKELVDNIPFTQTLSGEKKFVLYDVACGTGDIITLFLNKTQKIDGDISITGFDIAEKMLDIAAKKNTGAMLSYINASAEKLPVPDRSADCLTIAFGFRNVDNRSQALQEFYRVLKPGGSLLILDFFSAKNSMLQGIFNFYFRKVLPIIGGIFSNKQAYDYLPQSVSSMPAIGEFHEILHHHNFSKSVIKSWLFGTTVLFKYIKN